MGHLCFILNVCAADYISLALPLNRSIFQGKEKASLYFKTCRHLNFLYFFSNATMQKQKDYSNQYYFHQQSRFVQPLQCPCVPALLFL